MNEINFDDFHKEIRHAENYLYSSRESAELKGANVQNPTDDRISVDSFEKDKGEVNHTDIDADDGDLMRKDLESTIFFASDIPHIDGWEKYHFVQRDLGSIVSTNQQDSIEPFHNKVVDSNMPADKEKYLKSREDLLREDKEQFIKTHTFKPTISNTGRQGLQRSLHLPTKSSLNKITKKSVDYPEDDDKRKSRPSSTIPVISHRIEELLSSHKSRQDELLRQRKELELMELSQCSFAPRLSKGTNDLIAKQRQSQGLINSSRFQMQHAGDSDLPQSLSVDVSQRLYDDAEIRLNQRLWLENEVKQHRSVHDTFRPHINNTSPTSSSSSRKPLHERIYDIQQDKQRHLNELSAAIANSQVDMTFEPKIDTHSRILAERRIIELQSVNYDLASQKFLPSGQNDVSYRLFNESKRHRDRQVRLQNQYERMLSDSMMQPDVSPGTKKLAETNDVVSANFTKRSEMIRKRQQRKEEERRQAESDLHKSWFQPHIYEHSEAILKDRRPEFFHESNNDRYNRMVIEHLELKESNLKVTESDMYGHHTFNPSIDPISKALGRDSSISELYDNTRGKTQRLLQREKIEALNSQECTFHPKINDNSLLLASNNDFDGESIVAEKLRHAQFRVNIQGPEKMSRNIRQQLIEKEERRQAELRNREMKDLEDCTFQPNIKPYNCNQNEGMIVVKGLDRYVALKHLSNKLKEEALQREKDVFSVKNIDKFRRPEDGSTIVKSFKFHESKCNRLSSQ